MSVSEENRFYQIFETIKSNLASNNAPVDFPLLEKAYRFARDAIKINFGYQAIRILFILYELLKFLLNWIWIILR